MTEDDAKRAREAGMARAEEVKGLVQTERQRQAERIEARLAQRRNNLRKREAAVVQGHQWVEARVELDQERERLQANPVSKTKNKQLLKELHKVNNIIASLQQGGPGSPPQSRLGAVSPPRSPLPAARLVDIDDDLEGSEEEV
uniref:Uncharacterized protein n=1 Tax=Alexandrium catenella TaxID=2925 RepID=A0A7S1M0R9_ALECA